MAEPEELSERELQDVVQDVVDDDWHDITEEVENYQHGKTMECPCGQGIGVHYGELFITCAGCGLTMVDFKCGKREPPERDKDQASLGQFV